MITKDQIIQQKNMVGTYPNRNLTFVSGEGVYLVDEKGNKYLDMTSNYGVNVLGHSNKAIRNALHKQIDNLTTLHCSFNNDTRSRAMLKLVQRVKSVGVSKVYWSNSGAEAVEAAIKFAITHTGKERFVCAKNGYHGKTLGALSMTSSGGGKYRKPFKNILLEVDEVEFSNIDSLRETISQEHAAVILEPVQGEAGVMIPDKDYLLEVSRLCKEKNVLLIIDEIQTGIGRTGTFINVEKYNGFSCDILCMAKGIGGGIPVGATIISEEVNSNIPKGLHTNTFGGNPLSMSGVLATMEYFESSDVLSNVRKVGEYFTEQLLGIQKIYSEIVTNISSIGLMIGVEVNIDPLIIVKSFQQKGVLVAPTSSNRFRFLPPLIITKEQVDEVISKFNSILERIKNV